MIKSNLQIIYNKRLTIITNNKIEHDWWVDCSFYGIVGLFNAEVSQYCIQLYDLILKVIIKFQVTNNNHL